MSYERDHPSLRDERVDTSIWSPDVVVSDHNTWEDHNGGWANDPRPLYVRMAEVVAQSVLPLAAFALALFLVSAVFFD